MANGDINCTCYWFPVSPDDEDQSNDQHQHTQGQQDAQGDDQVLVRGQFWRIHLYGKLDLLPKDFE